MEVHWHQEIQEWEVHEKLMKGAGSFDESINAKLREEHRSSADMKGGSIVIRLLELLRLLLHWRVITWSDIDADAKNAIASIFSDARAQPSAEYREMRAELDFESASGFKKKINTTCSRLLENAKINLKCIDHSHPRAFSASKCGNPKCSKFEAGPGEFKTCGGCNLERYCSRACQKVSWREHKEKCMPALVP